MSIFRLFYTISCSILKIITYKNYKILIKTLKEMLKTTSKIFFCVYFVYALGKVVKF